MEMNLSDITAHWVALHEALGLGAPVRDEAHYAQLPEVAESLMDNTTSLDTGPLAGLAELLGDRIREYEDRAHPWPDNSTPATRPAAVRPARSRRTKRGVRGVIGQAGAEPASNKGAGSEVWCADGSIGGVTMDQLERITREFDHFQNR